uniref:hypothetical protein n=1 Tax=Castellaniella defragrans TaxID=75697 RepID=UPI00333F274A
MMRRYLNAIQAYAHRTRGAQLWALLAIALAALVHSVVQQRLVAQDQRVIAALARGQDIEVPVTASPERMAARVAYQARRERIDAALPLVEKLVALAGQDTAQAQTPTRIRTLATIALYNLGNARMRQALAMLEQGNLSDAPQSVRLAKDYYVQALRFEPEYWNAKYNLDVASRLVRDYPDNDAPDEGDPPDPMSRLWTDLPGIPKGLP